MKLAEALIERKGLLEKIGTLEQRIVGVSTHQEGTEPVEDAGQLLKELEGAFAAFGTLIMRINRTNTRSFVTAGGIETTAITAPEGAMIAELIVQRDIAIQHQNALRRVAQTVRNGLNSPRRLQSEIRMVTKIDLVGLEHQIAQLGEAARKLDTQIQGANWNVELM